MRHEVEALASNARVKDGQRLRQRQPLRKVDGVRARVVTVMPVEPTSV
jgi:hypothetical protein